MKIHRFTIRVPASSANLGSGFDAIGIALKLYLELNVELSLESSYSLDNEQFELSYESKWDGKECVDLTKENNLCIKTCTLLLQEKYSIMKFPKYFKCRMINEIPLSRGLGSSATALVAGGLLAQTISNLYIEDKDKDKKGVVDKKSLLESLIKYENHVDNIGASLYGGICIGLVDTFTPFNSNPGKVHCMSHLQWNPSIKLFLIIPEDYELQTTNARRVLPNQYSFQDAIRQVQNVSLLVSCLLLNNEKKMDETFKDCLHYALKDRFHQPYRQSLIPGLEEILDKVNCRKKYKDLIGIVLSGAGPSILVLMDSSELSLSLSSTSNNENTTIGRVQDECVRVFKKNNIQSRVMELGVDTEGSTVVVQFV